MQENLYNQIKGKTRATIEYINRLESHPGFDLKQKNEFQMRINKILLMESANKMLEAIDYKPGKQPGIYASIFRTKEKEERE